MRRFILVSLALFIAASVATLIVFWVTREARPAPTPLGWLARVTTLAGDGAPQFRDAAQPTKAGFADPFGIAVSSDGSVYVADGGDSNRIRKIALDGAVTTLAGGVEGYADGPGQQASFNTPSGLALDNRGNLYVADTGNNRIRKITPAGLVSTIAGDGTAGYRDGSAAQARFDGPIGIALDAQGNIYVADTYNDRIRLLKPDGQVSTVAGAGRPGYVDGEAGNALFDTPCGIAVAADGALIVADTGNSRLRRIAPGGQVASLQVVFPAGVSPADLSRPVGVAMTHDGILYATELDRARVVQVAPDGAARVIAGNGPGYADGLDGARFNQITGVAVNPTRDHRGDLFVADGANYLVRTLSPANASTGSETFTEPLPRLTSTTLGEPSLPWPLDPQQSPHEVAATMGEVRGSFDSTDSRDHLHSGLDVFGAYGDVVRAVRSEKVASPLSNWGFESLNEGMHVGVMSYIHIHVGRDKDGKAFADPRFIQVSDGDGKLTRMRVRRGARFNLGDALGTVNRMYHVHLKVGPSGAETNPLSLQPVGFADHVAPEIERDGIQLLDAEGKRFTEKRSGRLVVRGLVRIVVDAFDRNDMNSRRRRLGLYRLGYQVLEPDGASAPGFAEPRINLVFDRLPPDEAAPKLAYAEESGITVYGSKVTRFLYEVTNTVRNGRAAQGAWDTSELPSGDYILRIIAADYSSNEVQQGRDLLITVAPAPGKQ